MNKEMCRLIKPYKCVDCGGEMLFFTTNNKALIDYKEEFHSVRNSRELYNSLQYRGVKFLKCIECNKLYIINWSGGYPKQLTDKEALSKFRI